MTITFDFVQDFRKYREYITYVTKVDEAIGKLPFIFYQGDMLSCFVIEKKGDVVTVTMSNNTDEVKERFIEDAQPEPFEGIPEDVAYMYDVARHELIYNYDAKKTSSDWNWSTYPETFWMTEDEKYDHGLVLGADGKLCRLYLSNKRLISLFVGLQELELTLPSLYAEGDKEVTLQPAGVEAVLSIMASQLGQDDPKMNDVRTAIACDLVKTGDHEYAKYDFKDLIELFEKRGNEDDLWEDTWGARLDDAVARDRDPGTSSTLGEMDSYTNQLCLSELNDLSVVPETTRPIYVHMDIPIHGVHYMMIEPDQTLAIFYDDLIIKPEQLYQTLANLPEDQIALHGDLGDIEEDVGGNDYGLVDPDQDELANLDASGAVTTELYTKFDDLLNGDKIQ